MPRFNNLSSRYDAAKTEINRIFDAASQNVHYFPKIIKIPKEKHQLSFQNEINDFGILAPGESFKCDKISITTRYEMELILNKELMPRYNKNNSVEKGAFSHIQWTIEENQQEILPKNKQKDLQKLSMSSQKTKKLKCFNSKANSEVEKGFNCGDKQPIINDINDLETEKNKVDCINLLELSMEQKSKYVNKHSGLNFEKNVQAKNCDKNFDRPAVLQGPYVSQADNCKKNFICGSKLRAQKRNKECKNQIYQCPKGNNPLVQKKYASRKYPSH